MKATFRNVITALLVGAAVSTALGRQVYPYSKMVHGAPNPGDYWYAEASLAVSSQAAGHLAVSWMEQVVG